MTRKAPRWQWAVAITTAVLLPLALLATCAGPHAGYGPPEILSTAERDWPGEKDENRRLAHALTQRFPDGTDVTVVQAELAREGFHPGAAPGAVEYSWNEIACRHFVTVRWRARDGRVTNVTGQYGNICL